jgi:hypothetical protein
MKQLLLTFVIFFGAGGAGCGDKIGDSCSLDSDCSAEGGRVCLEEHDGYCSVPGCDVDTCPSESVCVRFYSVVNLTRTCANDTECSLDEVCTYGRCALRTSETRFCMLKCDDHGGCRDGYECRDEARAALHGGEPVVAEQTGGSQQAFCAAARACTADEDCVPGDTCDLDIGDRFCVPP